MLQVNDVAKSYGDIPALVQADLAVAEGEMVALLGRNGAGKSTLLSIISGLLQPDRGTVTINGIDAVAHRGQVAPLIGVAPQETGVYPVLTVAENLHFFGRLAGASRKDTRRQAGDVAEMLELGPLLDRPASKLSGGETRRLHTGCALMHRPRLLMLDEPTVGADVQTRQGLVDAVKALTESGVAVIYTTHYFNEVEALGCEVVIIDRGRVLVRGTQAGLVAQHAPPGVEITFRDGTTPPSVADSVTELGSGRFELASGVTIKEVMQRLGDSADCLASLTPRTTDLETVFTRLTAASADDAADAEVGTVDSVDG